MAVVPYKEKEDGKKVQVEEMFDSISGKYDFLNSFLSVGIDKLWRKKALSYLKDEKLNTILDMATGTGELAIASLNLNPNKIIGVDLSEGMLEVGRKKIKALQLESKIELLKGDSEKILFPDAHFDAATVAFGVRNFENLEQGLSELCRVLKPGCKLVVLEFSQPTKFPVKQVYNFYFKNILPFVGKIISKDSSAYTYLPESVGAFPFGKAFTDILLKTGFTKAEAHPLSFGIASIYLATK